MFAIIRAAGKCEHVFPACRLDERKVVELEKMAGAVLPSRLTEVRLSSAIVTALLSASASECIKSVGSSEVKELNANTTGGLLKEHNQTMTPRPPEEQLLALNKLSSYWTSK